NLSSSGHSCRRGNVFGELLMRRTFAFVALFASVLGCGKTAVPKPKEVVPIAQIPPPVMAAAQKREPTVTFNKVIKAPDGIYEVQGKTKVGKIIEVEVNEQGKVVKVE
ncbi:MAG TPA: hypothetical protein VHE81_12140, partial [Lacipirellulaceae bacterium]|nr:hypothetical protein [Lacipirellulaceae bacterium]